MWAIIRKDLEQNRRALLLYGSCALLFPFCFLLFTHESNPEGFLGMVFSLVVLGAPLIFNFWFVGHEKVKGTLRLLRTLPVSETQIVAAKLILSSVLALLLLNGAILLAPWAVSYARLPVPVLSASSMLWMQAAVLFCCILCNAIFVALKQQVAMQVSYFTLFGIAGLTIAAGKLYESHASAGLVSLKHAVESPLAPLAALVVTIGLGLIAIRFGARLLEWKDWSDLEEG
jgi:ABC-type transport system involved in multi-copper enzyme maturation permease subunit